MTNHEQEHDNEHKHGEHGPEVTIYIDDKPVPIHRGNCSISELKTLGTVPQAYDLDQVIEGKLTPISDDGHVTIKGDERFISHPKDSASS